MFLKMSAVEKINP